MRAYRGDASLEADQARRGFKTYREMFTKKLNDLEHALRAAKDQQKEVNVSGLNGRFLVPVKTSS